MLHSNNGFLISIVALGVIGISAAQANTLRWASSGDSLTLDPHAQNEGPTHTLAHQMYEPLLQRDMAGEIIPALATAWEVTDDPSVWRFTLREGVKFHNGAEFNADDVVFSIERARQPNSAMQRVADFGGVGSKDRRLHRRDDHRRGQPPATEQPDESVHDGSGLDHYQWC